MGGLSIIAVSGNPHILVKSAAVPDVFLCIKFNENPEKNLRFEKLQYLVGRIVLLFLRRFLKNYIRLRVVFRCEIVVSEKK